MQPNHCPHCGKSLEALSGVSFCPFCGAAISETSSSHRSEPEGVLAVLSKLHALTDPKDKHALLTQAEKEFPDSVAIAEEQLFLGRLHERNSRNVDFSIIKCYLYNIYLHPKEISDARRKELHEEFFHHPQLDRCLALTDDQDAFLRKYLTRLAGEFISLFLRGDSRYMRRIFGLGLDSRAPKLLAEPVCRMLMNIRKDTELTPYQRELLMSTLYQAFSKDMTGDTQWLNQALTKEGVSIPV